MSPDEVQSALESTRVWDHYFQVHITGGEPFLNFPLLLKSIEIASELNIPCYVETNAGWCVREELTRDRFKTLQDAGLQAVLISCSPFHAETIPPKRTLLAISIALEIFGSQGVIVYLSEWLDQLASFGLDEPTPIEKYVDTFGSKRAGWMFWNGYGLISGGRSGYKLGHLIEKQPASAFQGKHCRQEILFAGHSHFDLYGNFISGFCGGLAAGDWHELSRILDDYSDGRYPPLVDILINKGPYGIFTIATEKYAYRSPIDDFAGKCHLCVDVRKHLSNIGNYHELKPLKFYETI